MYENPSDSWKQEKFLEKKNNFWREKEPGTWANTLAKTVWPNYNEIWAQLG